MQTPEERRERARVLGEAITAHLEGLGEDGGMLGDWILVATNVYVDDEGDANAQYLMAFSGGTMLQHVAFGLLDRGRRLLASGLGGEDEAD